MQNGVALDADRRQLVTEAGGLADSLIGSSSAAAPTALAVLAAITAPPAGVYRVRATIALTGTAETALQNVRLRSNAVVVSAAPSLSGVILTLDFPRVTVTAGNIDLQAIAGAVAGSIYNTVLVATRVE